MVYSQTSITFNTQQEWFWLLVKLLIAVEEIVNNHMTEYSVLYIYVNIWFATYLLKISEDFTNYQGVVYCSRPQAEHTLIHGKLVKSSEIFIIHCILLEKALQFTTATSRKIYRWNARIHWPARDSLFCVVLGRGAMLFSPPWEGQARTPDGPL